MSIDSTEFQALCGLIEQALEAGPGAVHITPDCRFLDDLGMDSVSVVALLVDCEVHFQVDIASEYDRLEAISTVGQALSFILSCRSTI